MRLLRELAFFGLGGVVGFLVDAGVLYALRQTLGLFGARGCSFLAAVLATWVFNRSITFKHRRSGLDAGSEFVTYFALMLFGGAINYGVYAWLVVSYEIVFEMPVIGVAVGSLAGMAVNLATSRLLIFRKHCG